MNSTFAELAGLGSATARAGGRLAVVDVDLVQVIAGSRAAGPARTVLRAGRQPDGARDVAEAEPGEVLS